MAFGGQRAGTNPSFGGTWTSGANVVASGGTVSVSVGDLILVAVGRVGTATTNWAGSCIDNLGNIYIAPQAASITTATASMGRFFYAIATMAGTLSSVTIPNTLTTVGAAAIAVAVIEGPFLPKADTAPANTLVNASTGTVTLTSSPTGAMTAASAADEYIAVFDVSNVGSGNAFSAPTGYIELAEVNSTTLFKAHMTGRIAAALTTTTPTITKAVTTTPTKAVLGTMTFKKDTTTTVFASVSNPVTGTPDTTFNGYTMRQLIPAASISDGTWTSILVKFAVPASTTGLITAASIGVAAANGETSPDLASAPTALTFGGATSLTIPNGVATAVAADPASLSFNGATDLVLSLTFSGTTGIQFETGTTGSESFYQTPGDTTSTTTAGYTDYGQKNIVISLKAVGTAGGTNTNIVPPQGNLAFSPTAVTLSSTANWTVVPPQGNIAFSPTVGTVLNKNMFVSFNRNLTDVFPHAEGWTMRQRIEAANLASVLGTGLQVSLAFGALSNGSILNAYVGHAAASGDPYDFDGGQVALAFSGSASPSVVGAVTLQSDILSLAPNVPFDIDGVSSILQTSGTSIAFTLSTTYAFDIIYLALIVNGASISSITDTAGLLWIKRGRASIAGAPADGVELWYAKSPGALSSNVIIANMSASASYLAGMTWGVSGANYASPFDTNASIPNVSTTTPSDPRVISTDSNKTIAFGVFRQAANGNPTAGAGFTQLMGADFMVVEYMKLVGAVTNLSVTDGAVGDSNGGIADAVRAATFVYDNTKPLIISVAFGGTRVDLAAYGG